MINTRRISDYQGMEVMSAANTAGMAQFVTFSLGEQDYCVDIMAVREIRVWSGTTRIPNSPEYMRGVINLRGAIVPVIDLRLRFGSTATEPTPSSVIIIISVGGTSMGLLVDSVSDIITVSKEEISVVPGQETERRNPFFDGLVNVGEKLIAVISLENLARYDAQGTSHPATPLAATDTDRFSFAAH